MKKLMKYPLLVLLLLSLLPAEYYAWGAMEKPVVETGAFVEKTPKEAPAQSEEESGASEEEPEEAEELLEFQKVEKDYFDDAVFIGDSRMVGVHDYSGLTNATYYASVGLSVYNMFQDAYIPGEEGEKITLEQALGEKQFGKIYLMVGINELGTGNEKQFFERYTRAVETLRKLQPDALIFVQGILCVTTERSKEELYINNRNIRLRNRDIQTLANGRDIFYIDVNEVLTNKSGALEESLTADGVHLKAAYFYLWTNFLLRHGIVLPETP